MTDTTALPRQGEVQFRAREGRLNIVSGDMPLLADCFAAVVLSNGVEITTRSASAEHANGEVLFQVQGNERSPALAWHLHANPEGMACHAWLEVTNTTAHPLAIERLDVLVAPSGYRQAPAAELLAAQTGWQSWSRATPPVSLPDAFASLPLIHAPPVPLTAAEHTLSPWMTLLRINHEHSMLAGFTSASDQNGAILVQPTLEHHRLVASTYLEGIALQPDATVRSETLLLLFDLDDQGALERYADELAATMNAKPWPQPIAGWATWYYFYTGCSEADVLRNLDMLSANRALLPIEYIRVDDSFQTHVGDWLTLTDKYPRGMRFLSDTIHERGYKAGVWMAPFLVSEHSETFKQHPEWVLHDHNDEPVLAIFNWNARHYALDPTHPEAMRWLSDVIGTMLNTWNYDYLMVDFLYAGALRGKHHDRSVTSVQAYRRGLEAIRAAAGERYVLGCGAPFAPSVGLVNGLRVGPDVATYWAIKGESDGSEPATVNAIRSTLARGWMHGRLWVNDPDPPILRGHENRLTLAEVQSLAATIALSGGVMQFSDDMSKLEADRVALGARLLPPSNQAAVPLGPCQDGLPTRMKLAVERPWERWTVAALFNWDNEARELTFDPAEWHVGLNGAYHLFDLWDGTHHGPQHGPLQLGALDSHGVMLLAAHADRGRPQVVGSTFHLLGGAVELANEQWADGVLTVELRYPGERSGEIAVYVPPGYTYEHAGDNFSVQQNGSLLRVTLTLKQTTTLALRFRS